MELYLKLYSIYDNLAISMLITQITSGRMLRRETSCFEPPRSGFARVQFPIKVKYDVYHHVFKLLRNILNMLATCFEVHVLSKQIVDV